MPDILNQFVEIADVLSSAPSLEEMPRRCLADKGINGPTAAHVIEEVHVPFNLSYMTFTTGSSAFQNIVGVVETELPQRCDVARRIFDALEISAGQRMLVTYAPLVNVFSKVALERAGISWEFLTRSSRDSFIAKLCQNKPDVIVGESSFIRASLAEAKKLGLAEYLPEKCKILAAGTPLDLELIEEVRGSGFSVHDLYGCQEFGWLVLDGVPLRDDLSLVPSPAGSKYRELVVGGLPMADSFPVTTTGHVCNPAGHILTYRRQRTHPEYEVMVKATTQASAETIDKVARTILRIKGRIVKVCPDLETNAEATVLELVPGMGERDEANADALRLVGPEKTVMFDDLVKAQLALQSTAKNDPTWTKGR
nr:acyl carrier protein [uncultured Cohaesibacter sp.]